MGKENGQPPLTSGVFRSEKMNLYNMFVQPAVLFDVTAELGELGSYYYYYHNYFTNI